MGATEAAILNQAKKSQGETNERLEALVREQQVTNDLLRRLITLAEPMPGIPSPGTW